MSGAIDALAAEVDRLGIDAVGSRLGLALRQADRLAALRALAPAGQGPPRSELGDAAQAVQDCYAGLSAR